MCIVTGPNIDIATKLIKRMKQIFETNLGILFSNKETTLELNGCQIEAYPSNHIDSFRALENPKFILIDEGDFFRISEQDDVRFVSERYIGKSDPYIVLVSTPNAPNGLFEKIEKEPEASCIYKRLKLDYTYGLNRIYTKEEIEKAKKSPGTIFSVVGTGGAILYPFRGKSPYIVTQFQNFGFLNIDIVDNGTKLIGSFYDSRNGSIKDHFTIIKN